MVNSEEKAKINIDTESFRLEIRKWNPRTRGFISIIAEWMQQEITKKEEVEKLPDKEEKIEEEPSVAVPTEKSISEKVPTEKLPSEKVPTDEPVSEELQKAVPLKSIRGSGTRVMSEDHVLKRYDNGVAWDVVLDYIYANIPDKFNREDVIEHLSEYYKTDLKRPINPRTAHNYAGIYIKYMSDEDTPYRIEWCDDLDASSVLLYKKVKPEKPEEEVEEQELSDVAVDIYDFAERSHWIDRKIPISIVVIEKSLPEYTSKEINDAVTELIRKHKVSQFPDNKVLF